MAAAAADGFAVCRRAAGMPGGWTRPRCGSGGGVQGGEGGGGHHHRA